MSITLSNNQEFGKDFGTTHVSVRYVDGTPTVQFHDGDDWTDKKDGSFSASDVIELPMVKGIKWRVTNMGNSVVKWW